MNDRLTLREISPRSIHSELNGVERSAQRLCVFMKKAGRFDEKRTVRWKRGWKGGAESKGSARHAIDMPFRRLLRFGGKKDPLPRSLARSFEWAMKNENTLMTQPFMRCRISKDSSHHAIFQKRHLLLPGCAHATAI